MFKEGELVIDEAGQVGEIVLTDSFVVVIRPNLDDTKIINKGDELTLAEYTSLKVFVPDVLLWFQHYTEGYSCVPGELIPDEIIPYFVERGIIREAGKGEFGVPYYQYMRFDPDMICPECNGTGGGWAGNGKPPCEACKQTGWKQDSSGPDLPMTGGVDRD
jgi:hypothetical protein